MDGKIKVFVDGQAGTTGLKINERLDSRNDIIILTIPPDKRKDPEEKRKYLNEADIVFLCLPDDAARESVSFITNPDTRVIDASTAHRTSPDWAYGFPELSKAHREAVKNSKRVSVPGCHATGFISAVYPLLAEGIISEEASLTCHSVTGYSGGGKSLIERFETQSGETDLLQSPQFYALGLTHKHLPEMLAVCGLKYPPLFTPIVANFYRGMTVAVPLNVRLLNKKMSTQDMRDFFAGYYADQNFVQVMPFNPDDYLREGFLGAMECNHTNDLQLFVFGNEEQILIISRFDNLGKGASGAAVQNMNIMLGMDERTGLSI